MSDAIKGLVSVGRSYLQAGQAREALAMFRYAIARYGASSLIDRWLGSAAQLCEEDDEAIAAYERAITHAPDDLEVTVNLAELYLNRVKIVEAAALLKRALALDPKITHPAGVRARVLIMKAKKQLGAASA